MNSEESKVTDAERSWLQAVYNLAVTDTRWAKEQSWRVVQWTLSLLGALLALFKYPFGGAQTCPFVVLVLIITVLGILFLVQLHLFAKSARQKSTAVEKQMPESVSGLLGSRGDDPNHVAFVLLQSLVLAVSALLAILGLLWIAP